MSANDVFKGTKTRMTRYEFDLSIKTLVGGIPSGPDVARKFIESKLKVGDARIMALAAETIEATGWRNEEAPTSAELDLVVDEVAKVITSINTFKRIDDQLVWEGRCAA